MHSRILMLLLIVGLFAGVGLLGARLGAFQVPGYQQGYEPVQPIAFSHLLHAGQLQIDCQYCHFGAAKSRHAGIPSANVCMNCHGFVTAAWAEVRAEAERAGKENRTLRRVVSPELLKLYDALGLDENLRPAPDKMPQPIGWVKVHNLPDFVYFDHRAHVSADMVCQTCHGPVETMVRLRQTGDLSMGWCVECHRDPARFAAINKEVHPSTDCSTCHY